MRRSPRRRQGLGRTTGLSFAEIMVAIVLLALVLVPVFTLFNRGAEGTRQTWDEAVAHGLATGLLQEAKGWPFADPRLAAGSQDMPVSRTVYDPSAQDPRFRRTLTVSDFPATAGVPYAYKVLVVEVAWSTYGIERRIHLSGLLFQVKR
ncbi:MAG: hypothetical protein GX442_08470 [Candidatus Riflebacteria bacterium]|nr:hypothetical protein [Candidatus Riflebacteria bacterium]